LLRSGCLKVDEAEWNDRDGDYIPSAVEDGIAGMNFMNNTSFPNFPISQNSSHPDQEFYVEVVLLKNTPSLIVTIDGSKDYAFPGENSQ
jgi:hypothetical protein